MTALDIGCMDYVSAEQIHVAKYTNEASRERNWGNVGFPLSASQLDTSNGRYTLFSNASAGTLTNFEDKLFDAMSPTSVKQLQSEMEKDLSFNATQMAKFIGISRASYYNHKKEVDITDTATKSYIRAHSLVKKLKKEYPHALNGIKRFLVEGKTLTAWLTRGQWDELHIISIAEQLNTITENKPGSIGEPLSPDRQRSQVSKTAKHA